MERNFIKNINLLMKEIETMLILNSPFAKEIDLFNGSTGMCLLFYQLFLSTNDATYRDIADSVLGRILVKVQERIRTYPSLSQICSAKFLLSYLAKLDLLDDFDGDYASLSSHLLNIDNNSINPENVISLIMLSDVIKGDEKKCTLNEEYKFKIIYEKLMDFVSLISIQKAINPHKYWKELINLDKCDLAYNIIAELFYSSILIRKLERIKINSVYISKLKSQTIITIRKYTCEIPFQKYEALNEVNKTYFSSILTQLLYISNELGDRSNFLKIERMVVSMKSCFFTTGYQDLLPRKQNHLVSIAIHSLLLCIETSKRVSFTNIQRFLFSNCSNLIVFLNNESDIKRYFRLPNLELNLGIYGVSGIGFLLSGLKFKNFQVIEIEALLPVKPFLNE